MCSCGFIEGGVHHSWLLAEQYLHAWPQGLYVQTQVNCCCGEVINLGSVELANANRLLTFLPSSN